MYVHMHAYTARVSYGGTPPPSLIHEKKMFKLQFLQRNNLRYLECIDSDYTTMTTVMHDT